MSDDNFEPLPIEDDTMVVPGRDQARYRQPGAEWSEWQDTHGEPALLTAYMQQKPPEMEWEWRRRKVIKAKSRTPDRGSKYHRTFTQTLPGDTHGRSVTVDVYDVLKAFGVTCPALQHAAKKILCAGLRGAKSATQDIEEAANSCRRAIELLEFDL